MPGVVFNKPEISLNQLKRIREMKSYNQQISHLKDRLATYEENIAKNSRLAYQMDSLGKQAENSDRSATFMYRTVFALGAIVTYILDSNTYNNYDYSKSLIDNNLNTIVNNGVLLVASVTFAAVCLIAANQQRKVVETNYKKSVVINNKIANNVTEMNRERKKITEMLNKLKPKIK